MATNVLYKYDVNTLDKFLSNSYYFLDGKIYFYTEDTGDYYLNGVLDFNLNDIIANNVYNISENELITQGYLKKFVFDTNYEYDSTVVDFTKLLYTENQFDNKDFYFISNNVGLANPDVLVGSEVVKIVDENNISVTNVDFYLITDSKNVVESDGNSYIYLTGIFSEEGVNRLFIIRGLVSEGGEITYLDVMLDDLSGTGDTIKNVKFEVDSSNRVNMLVLKDGDTITLEFFRYNGNEFVYIPNGYSPVNLNTTNYDFMFESFSFSSDSYYLIKHNDDLIRFDLSLDEYEIIPYRNTIYNGNDYSINFVNSRFNITEDSMIRIFDIEQLMEGDLNYGKEISTILINDLKIPEVDEVFTSALYSFMNKYVIMTSYSFMVFEISSELLGIRHYEEDELVELSRQLPDFLNQNEEVQQFFDLFEKYLNNNYYNHYDELDLDIHRYKGYEDFWWCALEKDESGNIVYKDYTEAEAGSTDKFFQDKYGIHTLNGKTFYQKIKELAYLKDPYLIDMDFIGYLARFLGYDFDLDYGDFSTMISKFATNTFNNLNYVNLYDGFQDSDDSTVLSNTVDNYIRFIVSNLPYWKKIKGTKNIVETLLMVFGISSYIQKMASIDYKMFYPEFLASGTLIDGKEISTPHLDITVDLNETDIDNDVLQSFNNVFQLIDDNLPINVVNDGFGAKIQSLMDITIFMYSRGVERTFDKMVETNTIVDSNYNPLFEVLDIGTSLPSGVDGDGYIITTNPQSQDDELYKYYNNQWNQLFPSLGYTVKNLADGEFYKYVDTGDYNLFVERILPVDEVLDIVTTEPSGTANFNDAYIYRQDGIDSDMLSVYNGVSWESYYSYIGKQVLLRGQEEIAGFDFDGENLISAYTNPTMDSFDSSIYFKFKTDGTVNGIFLKGMTNTSSSYNSVFVSLDDGSGEIGVKLAGGEWTYTGDLELNVMHEVLILFTPATGASIGRRRIYVDGVLMIDNNNIDNSLTPTYPIYQPLFVDYPFGVEITRSGFVLADFTVYNEALTEQEAINVTGGNFDNSDSRIVFYESFNNITLGTITGTEQYAEIQEGTENQTLIYDKNGDYNQFI